MRVYEVVVDHKPSFSYAVQLKSGDTITVTDKEQDGWVWCIGKDEVGVWVPKAYIDRKGRLATMLVDYDSREFDVCVGDEVRGVTVESGWILCIDSKDQEGWVPVGKVRQL